MNDVNCEKRKRTMNYIGFLRPNQPGYGFKLYSSKTWGFHIYCSLMSAAKDFLTARTK